MDSKVVTQKDSSSRFDLLFIGTAIVDSIIKGFDPEPVSATGYKAESGSLHVGGEAVNGSVAATKLGAKTAILCRLGNDAAGSMIESELMACGVDTGHVVKSSEYPTPVTTLFVAGDGSRKSITNKAHRYNFHPERYTGLFADTKAIVLGSLFRAPFDDPEVIFQVVNAAHSKGVTVFADTKLPNFTKLGLGDLSEVLPLIDYITPNEDEARYYTGESDPERQADIFLDAGVKHVIIKLGPQGCFFKNREGVIRLPACNIKAVDATGAGDTFLAGFASEIVHGSDLPNALTFANACGAVCTTAVGAGTALHSRADVLKLLKKL